MQNIRAVIWGFGAMGSGIAKMILNKKGIEIAGVCDLDPNKIGRDMFDVLGRENTYGKPVIITDKIEKIISDKSADIAILATDSFVNAAYDKIKFCVNNRINVISTAEEMAYPRAHEPELAAAIDEIAKEKRVAVLGTGINPGFVLDLLIIALTGVCERVDFIKAARINDLSPFGPAVMREQGVGVTPDEFKNGVEKGTIEGHVGFPESIGMMGEALGWQIDKIEQTREPIISGVDRKTGYAEVKPGNVAGCRQCGYAYVNGEKKIELEHPQQIKPEREGIATGDYITIKGVPGINLQINPEIAGGTGTIAMCVNMIPFVIAAKPGLKTMLDMPIPRCYSGDLRDLI